MKRFIAVLTFVFVLMTTISVFALPVSAEAADDVVETQETAVEASSVAVDNTKNIKAIAAAAAIAVVAAVGAIAMCMAVCKSADGIARQPEAESGIRSSMMMGLVFIETAIIYALVVVILIIFVL